MAEMRAGITRIREVTENDAFHYYAKRPGAFLAVVVEDNGAHTLRGVVGLRSKHIDTKYAGRVRAEWVEFVDGDLVYPDQVAGYFWLPAPQIGDVVAFQGNGFPGRGIVVDVAGGFGGLSPAVLTLHVVEVNGEPVSDDVRPMVSYIEPFHISGVWEFARIDSGGV